MLAPALILLFALVAAADAGPVQLAHFHVGIVFGVFIAWVRWRLPKVRRQPRSVDGPAPSG